MSIGEKASEASIVYYENVFSEIKKVLRRHFLAHYRFVNSGYPEYGKNPRVIAHLVTRARSQNILPRRTLFNVLILKILTGRHL